MGRFAGFPGPDGLLVLDTWTGEVVRLPHDGSAPIVVRSAVARLPTAVGIPAPPHEGERFAPAQPASERSGPFSMAEAMPSGSRVSSESESSAGQLLARQFIAGQPTQAQLTQAQPTRAQSTLARSMSARLDSPQANPPSDALDREIIAAYPYPIAFAWRAFLREPDPRHRCKLLVDAFTAVLKMWALQLSSEYLEASGVKDASINETITRDLQRPLISAWNLAIQRIVPVLRQNGVPLFAPELAESYEELETKCRDRVMVKTRYEDSAGEVRFRSSKLGKIIALIRYRNSLAHGYNQSSEKAERDLEEQLPILRDVMKSYRYALRYPLFYQCRERNQVYRLMGAEPSSEVERLSVSVDPDESPLFLFDEGRGRALRLGVFAQMEPVESGREAVAGLGRDLALYEGKTRSTLIYVSVGGEHLEKQSVVARWRALTERKQVSHRTVTAAAITLDGLREAASRQSDRVLSTLRTSEAVIPDVTVRRESIRKTMDRFGHGDFRALVLGGGSGAGKSTVLSNFAEERRAGGDVVLVYRGATLVDAELAHRIVRDLAVRAVHLEDALAGADGEFRKADDEKRRLYLIVDGVTDFPGDTAALVRAIDAIVRQADSFPWFRVLLSVRTAAYERLPAEARFGRMEGTRYLEAERARGELTERSNLIEIEPFTDAEVGEAYERYRSYRRLDPSLPEDQGIYVFRPQTPFVELRQGGTTRSLMRTPLMLRLLLQAFHRRALPSDVSFDDAMALFFEQVVLQKNEPGGGYPERGVVLRAFVRELDSRGQPSLSRDQLLQVEALKVALQNTQRDSPYVQLLDHGVLLEEWEGDRCTVRFAFDGLLEYLLAERHDQRVDTADDLRGLVGRSQGFRALRGAAQIILRRALMYGRHDVALSLLDDVAMDAPRGVSGSALRSLPPSAASADEGPEVTVIKLVRDVLVELAWLGHPAYADFLRAVVATPSYADVEMLSETFDRLYVQGEAAAAEAAALAIRSEAERLGDPISRMSGALRLAQVRQHAGAVEEAHELLCEARDAAVESGEPVRVARTDMMLARILTLRGKLDDALQVFERVQLEFERVGAMAEAGEAVRGRATVSRRRGQLDEAERLTRRAIELSEQVGAVDALSKAFNNLGTILTAKKDVAGAERAFREALRLKEELGDRMSMGVTLMNLGALFFSAGDHDQAVTTWHEALQTCEQCNHLEGVAMVRVNLGVHFYYTRRELEPALDALTKSHAIFEQLEDPNHSAYACWHLAGIALDRHREEEAQRWIDRFDANVGGLEHPRFMVQRQALRLRQAISKTERIDEEAETLWSLAEAHRAERWDVEDGPAGALLDLVTYLRGEGREEESRRWLTRLKTIIGGRTFVRDAELEALAPAH